MLTEYWTHQGLELAPGCVPATIAAFERRHRLVLPPELRALYLSANGMKQNFESGSDANGFSFWPLEQVTPVDEFVSAENWQAVRGCEAFFVFADYLQLSWVYAIHLGRNAATRVILVGKDAPELIADSFDEFVAAYVVDSSSLYGGTVFDSNTAS